MSKKNIIVLTGAGISQESGIPTFRDSNGLWENHDVKEVATPEGWKQNPELLLRFYNERRALLKAANPNAAHHALKKLEEKYEVNIITQNIDNLHERAGSSNILHLHGELNKVRSVKTPSLIYEASGDIHLGDTAQDGGQLRPHIVWFGEEVPLMEKATELMGAADILIIIGTSMVVYPAAGLINFAPKGIQIYCIDPKIPSIKTPKNLTFIQEKATIGVTSLVEKLMAEA